MSNRNVKLITNGDGNSGFALSLQYDNSDGTENMPAFFDANENYTADVILPPVKSANGRGIILLKSILLDMSYHNPTQTPITFTVRVYKKGNRPKDDPTDSPDLTRQFTAVTGEKIIQFPPIFSEEFLLRFSWNIPLETTSQGLYYPNHLLQSYRVRQGILVVKRIAVETEEYGDIRNVWGESV